MIKNGLILFVCFIVFCCKKKTSEPLGHAPEFYSVNCNVISYDSLGNIDGNNVGLTVNFLHAYSISTNDYSTVTNSGGIAVFNNISSNSYVPTINKIGYDYAPLIISSNGPSSIVNINIPFAKQSPYKMDTLIGAIYNKDSITLTFNLSKPIPAGKFVKLAVITGTNNGLNPNDFTSVDIVNLTSPNINKLNIAKLPNLVAAIATLSNTSFYVNAIPVTYGNYYSNLLFKSVLLGDNLYYKNNLIFLKNW